MFVRMYSIFMYACMHTHTYVEYMHTYMYTRIHVRACNCTYMCIHYVHGCVCTCAYIPVRLCAAQSVATGLDSPCVDHTQTSESGGDILVRSNFCLKCAVHKSQGRSPFRQSNAHAFLDWTALFTNLKARSPVRKSSGLNFRLNQAVHKFRGPSYFVKEIFPILIQAVLFTNPKGRLPFS